MEEEIEDKLVDILIKWNTNEIQPNNAMNKIWELIGKKSEVGNKLWNKWNQLQLKRKLGTEK